LPATLRLYTLSLHDALPILPRPAVPGVHALPAGAAHHRREARHAVDAGVAARCRGAAAPARDAPLPRREGDDRDASKLSGAVRRDRKSTRLNSSHGSISYAV